jgi:uncharacterized membrane protein YesL
MFTSAVSTLCVAGTLVAISLALLAGHWRSWQGADHGGLAARERLFYQRQFRRRSLVSAAIGLVGLLLASGLWLESKLAQLLLAGLLMIILLCVILLALVDMLATRVHFSGESAVHAARIQALRREADAARQQAQREPLAEPPHDSEPRR